MPAIICELLIGNGDERVYTVHGKLQDYAFIWVSVYPLQDTYMLDRLGNFASAHPTVLKSCRRPFRVEQWII